MIQVKIKQNLKQSKGCGAKHPLQKSSFSSPATALEKSLMWHSVDDVKHRPVGNPKRKV
jgi:hypothetical protein